MKQKYSLLMAATFYSLSFLFFLLFLKNAIQSVLSTYIVRIGPFLLVEKERNQLSGCLFLYYRFFQKLG